MLFSGTICNIRNKTKTITVQMHENEKVQQVTTNSVKAITPFHFQLEKVPATDLFLDTWATLLSVASLTYSHKTSSGTSLLPSEENNKKLVNNGDLCLIFRSHRSFIITASTADISSNQS